MENSLFAKHVARAVSSSGREAVCEIYSTAKENPVITKSRAIFELERFMGERLSCSQVLID